MTEQIMNLYVDFKPQKAGRFKGVQNQIKPAWKLNLKNSTPHMRPNKAATAYPLSSRSEFAGSKSALLVGSSANPFLRSQLGTRADAEETSFDANRRSFEVIHSPTLNWDHPTQYPKEGTSFTPHPETSMLTPPSSSILFSPKATKDYQYSHELELDGNHRRLQIIEELINSERNHVDSLKILSSSYLDPFLQSTDTFPMLPLIQIQSYVKLLVRNHFELLNICDELYFRLCQSSAREEGASSSTTLDLMTEIFVAVSQQALPGYLYEQYCLLCNQVLYLVKDSNLYLELVKNGCQTFTETVQGKHISLDLSFVSLLQKPIARVSKYSLMLEALTKTLKEDVKKNIALAVHETSLKRLTETFKNKLVRLNANLEIAQNRGDGFELLFARMNKSTTNQQFFKRYFGSDMLQFDYRCFGSPINWRVLGVISPARKSSWKPGYSLCVLFKTYLMIISVKFEIEFLIPLASTGISTTFEGLLILDDRKQVKLTFEFDYQLFELLFVFRSMEEKDEWLSYFNILIMQVNGPYNFDYSASQTTQLAIIPQGLIACDTCLTAIVATNLQVARERLKHCYFKKLIYVQYSKTVAGAINDDHDYIRVDLRSREYNCIIKRTYWLWSDEHSNSNISGKRNLTRQNRRWSLIWKI